MKLTRLDVHSVRNLEAVRLHFSALLNIFVGSNGGGKTSVLEAFCLLGRGKSFRAHLARDIINHQASELMVYGELDATDGLSHRLGVSKYRKGISAYKVDGETVKQSGLISKLPLQIITPNSFELLNGASQERRRFLDWMMFHVEHSYLDHWQFYQRALKQRTEALRKQMEPGPWEQEMAHYAKMLHEARAQYITFFIEHLSSELGSQIFLPIQMHYEPGWKTEESFVEILKKNRETDRVMGYSLSGPHRADLRWTINGRPVAKTLSRGQLKNLIVSIHLAQANMLLELTGLRPIWLLDDITSELDLTARQHLLRRLIDRKEQIFLTSVELDASLEALQQSLGENFGMFHVEHGRIKQGQEA